MKPYWITTGGILGTFDEGEAVQIFLYYNMNPYGSVKIISGDLPLGLQYNHSINAIVGTISPVLRDQSHTFTMRLENVDGIVDKNFTIEVKNLPISFMTDTVKDPEGNDYQVGQVVEYQFETNYPIGMSFTKGKLPEGLTFYPNGKLLGSIMDAAGTYSFEITTDRKSSQTFTMVVSDIIDRPPYWATLDGYLGNANDGMPFNFDLTGGDVDGTPYIFSLKPGSILPQGIVLHNGVLTGIPEQNPVTVYTFTLLISDGVQTVERDFYININLLDDEDQIFHEGTYYATFERGEHIFYALPIIGNSRWTRFEVTNGQLPDDLFININNGHVYGTVSKTAAIQDYDITITVYDSAGIEEEIHLIITIQDNFLLRDKRLSVFITGESRQALHELTISSHIDYDKIFRPGDNNFGITKTSELPILRYTNTTIPEIRNILEDGISERFKVTGFKSMPYQDSQGGVVCECVIATIDETLRGSIDDELKNLNLANIRNMLIANSDTPEMVLYPWQSSYMQMSMETGTIISANHGMLTGDIVYFKNQDMPSPFINDTKFYVIKINDNEFTLAANQTNANLGVNIQYNVNEFSRNVVGYRHINGIPLIYCKTGHGQAVSNSFTLKDDIVGFTNLLGLGDSVDLSVDVELFAIDGNFILKDN